MLWSGVVDQGGAVFGRKKRRNIAKQTEIQRRQAEAQGLVVSKYPEGSLGDRLHKRKAKKAAEQQQQ
ncbi:hypothetical protein [Amycolatopsis sp. NPDC051128]|uniref:hypothetical protein n=1 Tax=Amycolatopsis sp. NPDC051128 TaxID=3155412 RepID=UPI003436CDBC